MIMEEKENGGLLAADDYRKGYVDEAELLEKRKRQIEEEQKKRIGEQERRERKKNIFREVRSWVGVFAAAFALSIVVTRFVVINAEVPTESMEHLIEPGDRLFGFRLAYTFDGPKRYDVIIFRYPVDEKQNFIKRVIGLPGETVEIRDAKIYIDGSQTPLKEDYLPEKWVADNDGYVFEVPEDCYFVLGDNRNISLDARFWAGQAMQKGLADNAAEAVSYTYVRSDQILGRAVFKYYPEMESLLGSQ